MIRHTPWAEAAPDFAIGLRPIAPEAWLEGGGADPARKDGLLLTEPANVWGETEVSRPAQAEVLRLIETATGGEGDPALPPLWSAARLVADDLCLMEKRDGAWRLAALSLCSPTFFTAGEALGKSLAELHGPVPGFGTRFLVRLERIFDALRQDMILERRNWTLVNSPDLYLPRSAEVKAQAATITPAEAAAALFLRVERQTVRTLPSGGVLFTIRIWRDPLSALLSDRDRLTKFAQAWRAAPADFRAYKGLPLYDPLVEAFLAEAL